MKILLLGDSITDMGRKREEDFTVLSYGNGYPFFIEGALGRVFPGEYRIFNRGISGDRVVDLYARIKRDCWNVYPDVVSILIGINDIGHGLGEGTGNGVDIERYERIYGMLLEDTKKVLPNVKFMIMEPFFLGGAATREQREEFLPVKNYACVAKRLADKFGAVFVPLQGVLDELAEQYGAYKWLSDGVHPTVAGAKVIADEWLKAFAKIRE